MRMERGSDNRGGAMRGSCTYAGGNTAKGSGVKLYGVSEREKQLNDIRAISRAEIQISEPGILVLRILCGHGRKERQKGRNIYGLNWRKIK